MVLHCWYWPFPNRSTDTEGAKGFCAPEGKVVALAASMEHFYSMFVPLVEKLVDLVTHGRALKPVLRYYNKESKAVKDKE